MTATSHVVTGMLLASVIHQPEIALPLAFASHFVLDSLPHFGISTKNTRVFLPILGSDMFLAALLLLVVAGLQPAHWPIIVAAGIVAASPDLMWLPRFINDLRRKRNKKYRWFEKFHGSIQWSQTSRGIIVEVLWVVPMLWLLVHHLSG